MPLNVYKSDDQTLMLIQKQWTSVLNPLVGNALTQGELIPNISLLTGVTTFPHYLGRQMQGWILTDQSGAASIYRSAPMNSQTLSLTSDADVTISLWVF